MIGTIMISEYIWHIKKIQINYYLAQTDCGTDCRTCDNNESACDDSIQDCRYIEDTGNHDNVNPDIGNPVCVLIGSCDSDCTQCADETDCDNSAGYCFFNTDSDCIAAEGACELSCG